MDITEKQNLVNSVADDIVEVLTEKDYFDSDTSAVKNWVDKHLFELDLEEGDPLEWAEAFRTSRSSNQREKIQKPVSYLDKLEGLLGPVNKEEQERPERKIQESNLHSVASTVLGVPIWNLKRPVRENLEEGTFYECAIKQGKGYKGFENIPEAEKWLKRNYLSLITEIK